VTDTRKVVGSGGQPDDDDGQPSRPDPPTSGFRHGLRAFRHRNYRLFFAGALASNTGNWLQNLAVPFVLFELTQRSVWVGLAGFAQAMPGFFLAPIGGSMADRFDRRKVLLGTQFAMALSALALWGVWVAGLRDPVLILALVALTGVFSGLMIPTWQAFVPSLVPREDLASAITLNSTQFNAARALGPAAAGALLAFAGPSWAFLLNGLSFVAVIGAIWMVRPLPSDRKSEAPSGIVAGFTSALAYIRRRTGIIVGIVTVFFIAFLGFPVAQFAVVFTDQIYGAGPRVLGLLVSAVGVGAVMMAPLLSTWDDRIPRSMVVRFALPFYALSLIGFGAAPNWPLGLLGLLGSGAGFLAVVATTNTAVQLIVADEARGRVMSVRIMGFTFAFPTGSLLQGYLADQIGPQATVVAAGTVLLVFALALSFSPRLLASLDSVDDTPDR
jgi:MFS family permease